MSALAQLSHTHPTPPPVVGGWSQTGSPGLGRTSVVHSLVPVASGPSFVTTGPETRRLLSHRGGRKDPGRPPPTPTKPRHVELE